MKPSVGQPELVEVAPGVHAYIQPDGSWMINNTGAVVGSDDSLLLVDTTSTEARNRACSPRWRLCVLPNLAT